MYVALPRVHINLFFAVAPYIQYLHSVIEQAEEFREAKALTERWNTLEATSAQLQDSIAWHLKENEVARLSLQKYTEVRPYWVKKLRFHFLFLLYLGQINRNFGVE